MRSVLIKNIGALLTGDLKSPVRAADSIYVQGGLIQEIGNGINRQSDVVIDARGITAIPGLVDSHSHPTFGEFTPAQNSTTWIKHYMHGGDLEICSSGNARLVLTLMRAIKGIDAFHRVLIGTDTPGGTGVIPRGMFREVAFLASVVGIPPEIAICMATGNVVVGIGLGDSSVETMGLQPARLSYFEKAVADMRAQFAGKEAELESGKIHLLHPLKRRIPVYVAASGPKMLELAGRIADGIILLVGIDDNYIRLAKERIEAGAKAANRDPRQIDIVLWVPCSVSERVPAKAAVKAHVARVVKHPLPFVLDAREQKVLGEIRQAYNYYEHMQQTASQAQVIPDWLVDKFAIAGTRAECRAQIERLRKTGINQIDLIPYGTGGGDREETLKEFIAAVS